VLRQAKSEGQIPPRVRFLRRGQDGSGLESNAENWRDLMDTLVVDRDSALDPLDRGFRNLGLLGQILVRDAELPPQSADLVSVAAHAFSPQWFGHADIAPRLIFRVTAATRL
jgi:hypothetical protein